MKVDDLCNKNYIGLIEKILEKIINYDDQNKAYELANLLGQNLKREKLEFKNIEAFNFYNKIIIKLKFIALPLLENSEVLSLVKKYFTWQFRISSYDIIKKIKFKLINIEVYEERDKFRDDLRRVLLENNNTITSKARIKTIKDWLVDYNTKVGIKTSERLKIAQYFTDLKKDKELSENDIAKLKILFNFYEEINLSSLTPQGFEENVPIVINGELNIFRNGNLEKVEKKSPDVLEVLRRLKSSTSDKNSENVEYRKILNSYPAGSLERKAIEEEIARYQSGGGDKKF